MSYTALEKKPIKEVMKLSREAELLSKKEQQQVKSMRRGF